MITELLTGAVRGGTSIMYAGLGETVSERAGVINLGPRARCCSEPSGGTP